MEYSVSISSDQPLFQSTDTADSSRINLLMLDVFSREKAALDFVINNFPANAYAVVHEILATAGKVVIAGVGKSGHVAQKMVATFASFGIAAFSLNPLDALHGDLGAIQPADLFIALSRSGTGTEFEHIFPLLKKQQTRTILICCAAGALTKLADITVVLPFEREACLLNLAPTSSSIITMAFGDALAVAVSTLKNFTRAQFAQHHPAGALGRRLFLTVSNLMDTGDLLPLVTPNTPFKDLLVTITSKKRGVGIMVDDQHRLLGVITDGDLRRALERGPSVFDCVAADLATLSPKFIRPDMLAYAALAMMEDFKITTLVVVDDEKVTGLIHIHDIVKAGIKS
jgi:arabinose-5-phosphate isomerase